MALQCNIDRRGKLVRLLAGTLFLMLGIAMSLWWAGPVGEPVPWVLAGTCVFGGAFMIFEATAGWCVVRAMGVRTKF